MRRHILHMDIVCAHLSHLHMHVLVLLTSNMESNAVPPQTHAMHFTKARAFVSSKCLACESTLRLTNICVNAV